LSSLEKTLVLKRLGKFSPRDRATLHGLIQQLLTP